MEPLPGTWSGAVSARGCPWPSNTPSMGQLPHKLDTVLLGGDFQYTRMGVGKGNGEVVNA